jgi:hypothetical protein
MSAWHQDRLADWLSVVNNFNFSRSQLLDRVPEVSYWTDLQKSSYWTELQEFVIGESSRQDSRRQEEAVPEDGVSECTVSQESLWLWYGDSSGTQERERPPLEPVLEDCWGTADQEDQVRV